jgi:hypothetical protein
MTSTVHATDPCPELPSCFRRPLLHGPNLPEFAGEFVDWLATSAPAELAARWQPTPATRTCVATMQPLETFRWMVQAEAQRRHCYTAARRAFVGDGSHGNWTLWRRHFAEFVAILDFVHAAEYLHAAGRALGSATQGLTWTAALWQGRSVAVIAELHAALASRGIGPDPLAETHELFDLQHAWVYLSNAADKLDYPRYRREGLPTTSSLIESQIKEGSSEFPVVENRAY